MRANLLVVLLLTASSAQASAGEIEQMFRSMLAPGAVPPTEVEFYGKAGEQMLTKDEAKNLLPLARTALKSEQPKVRSYGLQFFLGVSIRPTADSAELLSPYIPDLEQIVTTKGDPLKRMALTVMTFFHPRIPEELLKFLSSHLQDPDNEPEDAGLEAVALLESRDPALIHQLIGFVQDGKHPFVSGKVLQQLGLMQTTNPGGLSFIESSLDNPDPSIRWYAVGAVSGLPQPERTRFLSRLNRMAADPKETDEIRSQIVQALKN
jgi:hypothetical protein